MPNQKVHPRGQEVLSEAQEGILFTPNKNRGRSLTRKGHDLTVGRAKRQQCTRGQFKSSFHLGFKHLAEPAKAAPNKKPMAMLEEARRDVLPELSYRERKQAFLQSMMSELKASWKPDSMAWVNLHVAGYYYTLDGVTHPRQLASCCLRLDSTQECRWSCWACNLEPG